MTVLESIQKSTDFLAKRGVDSPRLQSELLLAQVLKTRRLKLYLDFARALTEAETSTFRELIQRRARREPLQHILGTACFCGLEIAVNPHVLIPRPETEMLAEEGWKYLKSLGRESVFLDFGTGSGCIAIAICHEASSASAIASDRSAEALAVARENSALNRVAERIQFVESDAFATLPEGIPFDLIISNPPYIPAAEIDQLQPEVRDFDPRAALDGGADGLDFYRLLAREAKKLLKPDGLFLAEFGDGQSEAVREIFGTCGWQIEQVIDDYAGKPRIIKARR